MTETSLGERVAKVEVKIDNLQNQIAEMKQDFRSEISGMKSSFKSEMDDVKGKQDQMLEILTQARGMQRLFKLGLWVVGGTSSTIGVLWGYWPQIRAFLFKVGS